MDQPDNLPSTSSGQAQELDPPAERADLPVLEIPLTPQIRALLARVESHSFEQFSGPLPPPETLSGYNHVLPGLAERIVALTEREQAHRHLMTTREMDLATEEQQADDKRQGNDLSMRGRGQLFAFCLFFAVIALGWWMTANGEASAAAGMVGTVLTAGVVAMITLRWVGSHGKAKSEARHEQDDSPDQSH